MAVFPSQVQIVHMFLGDDVQTPEREEDVGLDPFTQRGVGHHQRWVNHIERALGCDETDLAIAVVFSKIRDHRCVCCHV
jgi:hypothetical protein